MGLKSGERKTIKNQIIVHHLTLQDDDGKDRGVTDCELRELSKEEGGGWIGGRRLKRLLLLFNC